MTAYDARGGGAALGSSRYLRPCLDGSLMSSAVVVTGRTWLAVGAGATRAGPPRPASAAPCLGGVAHV